VPDRFERGTPALELLAGVTAAVDWIAALAEHDGNRRERVLDAQTAVEHYLAGLLDHALRGLAAIPGVRMLGAPERRTSTISFVVEGHHPSEIAKQLARERIAVWAGDNYAYELMRRFGLGDSGGAIRASIVLYNDRGDVDRLLEALAGIARA
jgi:selenocysteine lyase/cysteine desulfurase